MGSTTGYEFHITPKNTLKKPIFGKIVNAEKVPVKIFPHPSVIPVKTGIHGYTYCGMNPRYSGDDGRV